MRELLAEWRHDVREPTHHPREGGRCASPRRDEAELLEPATIKYAADALAAALNRLIDDRPVRQAERQTARDDIAERLQRLVVAIEQGVPASTVAAAIVERQAELARLDAELTTFAEPLQQRLAVIPAWVEQQLQDVASLLSEAPARTKAEFRRSRPTGDDGAYLRGAQAVLPSPC